MGYRDLPTECEHGRVVDHGDFGPDIDWDNPTPDDLAAQYPACPDCERQRGQARKYRALAIVHALHDARWCRCPDDRTMLCAESAAVVEQTLGDLYGEAQDLTDEEADAFQQAIES